MAKKKPIKKKKAPKPTKRVKFVKRTHGDWLLHLIKVSEDAITGQGTSIDEFFSQQAARLRRELEEWKAKGTNE